MREKQAWRRGVHAQLGLAVESLMVGSQPEKRAQANPWDAWWIAYRLARPAGDLALDPARSSGACPACRRAAADLAASTPPRHTDELTPALPCTCLLAWCTRMRAPAAPHRWPTTRLTLALLKPGAPNNAIGRYLERHYRVLRRHTLALGRADIRRLYPEAYGEEFVAAVDAYLTSGPSQVLVLYDPTASVEAGPLKAAIRSRLSTGPLRNHIHMADNPGETFADLAHFVGIEDLTELYGIYETDLHPARMAHYRHVLGRQPPRTGRLGP